MESEWMDGWIDRQIKRWMGEWRDVWLDRHLQIDIDKQMQIQTQMDRWVIDEQMQTKMDMDGWVDRHGQMNKLLFGQVHSDEMHIQCIGNANVMKSRENMEFPALMYR